MNILCMDAGTSGMRGIVFDHMGERIYEYRETYRPVYLKNGRVEQDPADWERALYRILRHVAKEVPGDVDAISFTAFRSSVIPVDENVRPLCPAMMWQDKRADVLCEQLREQNERVAALSGARIHPVFSGAKMRWIRENVPDIYENTFKFMVAADYLLFLLTGKICTDHTYGSRSNLMNLQKAEWDEELLSIFHVERSRLCPLVPPGSVCGYTTDCLQQATGFPAGVPVITAGGDQQCGALGQGVVRPGILSVTAGTGGFLITNVDRVPEALDEKIICNASSVRGQYILEYSMLTCCSAYDWFRKEWFGELSLEEMERMLAQTSPGAHGCLCVPYFMGRSTPDWNKGARGAFFHLSEDVTRWDMMRSLLEGLCYEIDNGIEILGNYVRPSEILVNGGLTNSDLFNKMQADIYGKKIMRRGRADATARGALIAALVSLGVYDNEAEAFDVISEKDRVEMYHPDEKMKRFYADNREKMNLLYEGCHFLEETVR